jgi:sec-independent protein translocase protein TatC
MIVNTWRADDYLSFVAFTALIFGIAFEMPMVILILAQIDLVQTQTFRNIRKYAYFGILIAAVIAAPSGDLMTLGFLFIPLVVLYEVGIIAAAIATRGRPLEE